MIKYPTLKRAYQRSHRERLSRNYAKSIIEKAKELRGTGLYHMPNLARSFIAAKSKRIDKRKMIRSKIITLKVGGQISISFIPAPVKKGWTQEEILAEAQHGESGLPADPVADLEEIMEQDPFWLLRDQRLM